MHRVASIRYLCLERRMLVGRKILVVLLGLELFIVKVLDGLIVDQRVDGLRASLVVDLVHFGSELISEGRQANKRHS